MFCRCAMSSALSMTQLSYGLSRSPPADQRQTLRKSYECDQNLWEGSARVSGPPLKPHPFPRMLVALKSYEGCQAGGERRPSRARRALHLPKAKRNLKYYGTHGDTIAKML